MKIIKLEKMPKFEWRSPLVPPESEEDAQDWAKGRGVDVLYYYERHGKRLWLVEASKT